MYFLQLFSFTDSIDSVESVGALEPDVIFEKSCEVFIEKLKYIKESLNSKGLIRSE